MSPSYEPLIAPARATAQVWRLVLGFGIVVAIYVLWMIGIGAALWLHSGLDGFERQLTRIGAGSDPWSLILLLSTFLGGWLGLWLALRLLHRRHLRSLLGRAPIVLRDFFTGLAVMALVGGLATLAILPLLPALALTDDPGAWLAFLPLAALGIGIQTGAEELLFRGYVQSQLAARFGRPLLAMVVPSVLFGLAHYNAAALGANAWIVVASTALFGLMASDLTMRTGSLGLAWGLHFANNVLAILILGATGNLDGLALLQMTDGAATAAVLRPLLISDIAMMAAVWIACRIWLRRR